VCQPKRADLFVQRVTSTSLRSKGLDALFDGYEDCIKVEEKSWHASFASTNMVMQAY
jgi:hypothetical protein